MSDEVLARIEPPLLLSGILRVLPDRSEPSLLTPRDKFGVPALFFIGREDVFFAWLLLVLFEIVSQLEME